MCKGVTFRSDAKAGAGEARRKPGFAGRVNRRVGGFKWSYI